MYTTFKNGGGTITKKDIGYVGTIKLQEHAKRLVSYTKILPTTYQYLPKPLLQILDERAKGGYGPIPEVDKVVEESSKSSSSEED